MELRVAGIVPVLPLGVTRINRMDCTGEVIHQTQELDRTRKIVVGHKVGHSEVEGGLDLCGLMYSTVITVTTTRARNRETSYDKKKTPKYHNPRGTVPSFPPCWSSATQVASFRLYPLRALEQRSFLPPSR